MNAREKASELIVDFQLKCKTLNYQEAKQCALIAVDEILNNNCGSYTDEANATNSKIYCDEYFWQDVKSELRSL
jgi:hypothetical protein